MVVDKLDVAAVRACERGGLLACEAELASAGLEPTDYRARLRRLEAGGVVRGYKAVLVVPPLLGGDWVWAAMLATSRRPLGTANALCRKLPFVADVIINSCLPERPGPNLALTFYSRDLETEAQFIRSATGIEHQEVYSVAGYSFSIALGLSTEERALLRFLVANPAADCAAVEAALGKDSRWVRAKLDKLVFTEANSSGVIRIQPEVDWRRVENYGHFHFLVETGHKPKELGPMIADQGFELVLGGRPYQDRYVQLESDVWGMADLMERTRYLNELAGVFVAGVAWNASIGVSADWAAGLLG